jgi:serine/threonine protein kinase
MQSDTIQVGGITVNVVRPIAEGGYAQVLLVRSAGSNEMFALKRVICQSQEVHKDVQTELQVLQVRHVVPGGLLYLHVPLTALLCLNFQAVKHTNIMPILEFAEARQQNLEVRVMFEMRLMPPTPPFLIAHDHVAQFYFLFPYFERGSLWDAIEAARNSSSPLWPFTQHTALHLFHGICSGLLALHRAGFCHRDLKPHNVMLTSTSPGEDLLQYVPVLCDFGSCTGLRVEIRSRANSLDVQDEASRKSSAPYRAPELFEPTIDTAIDGQSDVWSLGCILYVLLPRECWFSLVLMLIGRCGCFSYAMAFGSSPFEHPREV